MSPPKGKKSSGKSNQRKSTTTKQQSQQPQENDIQNVMLYNERDKYRDTELEIEHLASERIGIGKVRQRPDREPFVVDVINSPLLPTRAMPQAGKPYHVLISESFWRLAAYIDSVPARLDERLPHRLPHAILRGPPGCGKSYLLSAAAALLGFGGPQKTSNLPERRRRPVLPSGMDIATDFEERLHIRDGLSSAGRRIAVPEECCYILHLGDAKCWLESEDPLGYFRVQLLSPFSRYSHVGDNIVDSTEESFNHSGPSHVGCLQCVEPFRRLEQVSRFIDYFCARVRDMGSSQSGLSGTKTLLTIIIDQAEALIGQQNSIPYHIVEMLIAAKTPLLIFSITDYAALPSQQHLSSVSTGGVLGDFPFRAVCTCVINVPYRATSIEAARLIEIHGQEEDRLFSRDPNLWRDVRMWTGSVPAHLRALLASADASTSGSCSHHLEKTIPHRISLYRARIVRAVSHLLPLIRKMSSSEKAILLLVLTCASLRLPLSSFMPVTNDDENAFLASFSGTQRVRSSGNSIPSDRIVNALGPRIASLLLLDPITTFYHPTDGVISCRTVPAAVSLATHVALTSVPILATISTDWLHHTDLIVSRILSAPLSVFCTESRCRLARFYAQSRFLWDADLAMTQCSIDSKNLNSGPDTIPTRTAKMVPSDSNNKDPDSKESTQKIWRFEGVGENNEVINFTFKRPRVVIFAGHAPSPPLLVSPDGLHGPLSSAADSHALGQRHFTINEGCNSGGCGSSSGNSTTNGSGKKLCPKMSEKQKIPVDPNHYDAVVFIPGRTSYCFFDLFVMILEERRLYALTTSPLVGAWVRELQPRAVSSTLGTGGANINHNGNRSPSKTQDNTFSTPLILLESWREALRRAAASVGSGAAGNGLALASNLSRTVVRCCVLRPEQLLAAVGFSERSCDDIDLMVNTVSSSHEDPLVSTKNAPDVSSSNGVKTGSSMTSRSKTSSANKKTSRTTGGRR